MDNALPSSRDSGDTSPRQQHDETSHDLLTADFYDAAHAEAILPTGWKLSRKADWNLSIQPDTSTRSAVVRVLAAPPEGRVSYLRATAVADHGMLKKGRLEAVLHGCVRGASPANLSIAAYQEKTHTTQVWAHGGDIFPGGPCERHTVSVDLAAQPMPPDADKLYLLMIILLPRECGAALHLRKVSLCVTHRVFPPTPVTFRFDTFGDFNKGSSRLRAWKLRPVLEERGCNVVFNTDTACDVYVCQKLRPIHRARRMREDGSKIVFDFDDAYLLDGYGAKASTVAMLNSADVVTAGSADLVAQASCYHPNVHLFENPVDIISSEVVRPQRESLDRIGWFGAPEGRVQLTVVDLEQRIETITAGGDIEFNIHTVDEELIAFDLLVFPLAPTAWNLGKNANRMIKALALGIPVLASATPEHKTVARMAQLDARFLVEEGESWAAKVARLKADFAQVQELIERARPIVLERYGIEQVTDAWLRIVLPDKPTRPPCPLHMDSAERAALSSTTLLVYRYGASQDLSAFLSDDRMDWGAFGHRLLVTPEPLDNATLAAVAQGFSFERVSSDYFEIFRQLDAAVRNCTDEWLIVAPAGYSFCHGAWYEFAQHVQNPRSADVLWFMSQERDMPHDSIELSALGIPECMLRPSNPGIIAVRSSWLREKSLPSERMLSYWAWSVAILAMVDGSIATTSAPVAIRSGPTGIENVSENYRAWLAQRDPRVAHEIPNTRKQWARISQDVLVEVGQRCPEVLPSVYSSAVALAAEAYELRSLRNKSTKR